MKVELTYDQYVNVVANTFLNKLKKREENIVEMRINPSTGVPSNIQVEYFIKIAKLGGITFTHLYYEDLIRALYDSETSIEESVEKMERSMICELIDLVMDLSN